MHKSDLLGYQLSQACKNNNVHLIHSILTQVDLAFEHCSILKDKYYADPVLIRAVKSSIVNWGEVFKTAAQGGNLEIINIVIKRADSINQDQWEMFLECACKQRNWEMIHLGINNGVKRYQKSLEIVCARGYLDVVQFLVEKGCTNLNSCMTYACEEGHMEVIKYLTTQGANNWGDFFGYACYGGHLDAAQLMMKSIVLHCSKSAQNDYLDYAFNCACSSGHLHVVQYLVKLIETKMIFLDANEAIKKTMRNGHNHIVQFLIQHHNNHNNNKKRIIYCDWLDKLWRACDQSNHKLIQCIVAMDNFQNKNWDYSMSHCEIQPEGRIIAPIGSRDSFSTKIPYVQLSGLLIDNGAQGIPLNAKNASVFLNRELVNGVNGVKCGNDQQTQMLITPFITRKQHKQKCVSLTGRHCIDSHMQKMYILPCISFEQ